ncbi:MAG: ribosome maturation factor RimP [Candidatus Omnitrophota bacterium]|nr:ribosome maturation factor RimP [Candidatus Omnitrophota bacterium]
MDKQEVVDESKRIITDYLKNQGFDLVDIIHRYEGRDLFLRILVDMPEGGIGMDECVFLNNDIGRILEEKDILREKYILEVSSPGMDRPLKTKSDFSRCIGKRVRIFLNELVNGRQEWEGQILQAEDSAVYVDVSGEELQIPFSKIIKAKQVIK